MTTIPEFEFLIDYISLKLESGDEESGLGIWLDAVDQLSEEGRYQELWALIRSIYAHKLSSRAQAQVTLAQADVYEQQGDHQAAAEKYRRAIATFRKISDGRGEAQASNNLALLLQQMGQYPQASTHYQVAARSYRRLGDHKGVGEIMSNLGGMADARHEWGQALLYYQRAKWEFVAARATGQLARIDNNLGVAFEMLGDWDIAEEHYLSCADLLDNLEESQSESAWRVLNNLGQLYAKRHEPQRATQCYNSALTIAENLDSSSLQALTWNNLGQLADAESDKRRAAECFRESLQHEKPTGDRSTQAMVLNNLGSVLTDLGEHGQAQTCFQESLELSREFGDLSGEARTLNNFAVLMETLGAVEESIQTYQRAANLFIELQDVRREITTLTNLASVAWRFNRTEMGRVAFLKAWTLARSGAYDNELANLYQLRGDWAAVRSDRKMLARCWYEHALTVCQDERVRDSILHKLTLLPSHKKNIT